MRAIEDEDLLAEIVARRDRAGSLPDLPTFATGLYPDWAGHPFPLLMAAGARVTLNSDDPPYFHTSIGREYGQARDTYGLDDAALAGITRNGDRRRLCRTTRRGHGLLEKVARRSAGGPDPPLPA